MLIIRKGNIAVNKRNKQQDVDHSELDTQKAITDYNIMMGILEDPKEGDDDE